LADGNSDAATLLVLLLMLVGCTTSGEEAKVSVFFTRGVPRSRLSAFELEVGKQVVDEVEEEELEEVILFVC
jgi:hypothetical protein